ncbi:MAG: hypothetical protein MZV64_31825 [Ignavibacteriales bacterium]|nr:hypothetical protein [Ignavibacteriales bacterium]
MEDPGELVGAARPGLSFSRPASPGSSDLEGYVVKDDPVHVPTSCIRSGTCQCPGPMTSY